MVGHYVLGMILRVNGKYTLKENYHGVIYCTKPLSTIQCNKTLCQDPLVPILLIG